MHYSTNTNMHPYSSTKLCQSQLQLYLSVVVSQTILIDTIVTYPDTWSFYKTPSNAFIIRVQSIILSSQFYIIQYVWLVHTFESDLELQILAEASPQSAVQYIAAQIPLRKNMFFCEMLLCHFLWCIVISSFT